MVNLTLTALLVRDYEEAIDWYTKVLGFRLLCDEDQGGGKLDSDRRVYRRFAPPRQGEKA